MFEHGHFSLNCASHGVFCHPPPPNTIRVKENKDTLYTGANQLGQTDRISMTVLEDILFVNRTGITQYQTEAKLLDTYFYFHFLPDTL